jgi:GTP-binding protein HflX
VVDAANPNPEQIAEVERVLAEIGAADVPQMLVFNKLDAIEKSRRPLQLQRHVSKRRFSDGVAGRTGFCQCPDW